MGEMKSRRTASHRRKPQRYTDDRWGLSQPSLPAGVNPITCNHALQRSDVARANRPCSSRRAERKVPPKPDLELAAARQSDDWRLRSGEFIRRTDARLFAEGTGRPQAALTQTKSSDSSP